MSERKSEAEFLNDLEFFAQAERANMPHIRSNLTDDLAYRKAELAWYARQRDAMLDQVQREHRRDALDLWEGPAYGYSDNGEQRLQVFRGLLLARPEWIVDLKAMKGIETHFVDPKQRAKELAAAQKANAQRETIDLILKAVKETAAAQEETPAAARQAAGIAHTEALFIYNNIRNEEPDAKIAEWVNRLVQYGWLPLAWKSRQFVGSMLEHVKAMLGSPENKMLFGPRENK